MFINDIARILLIELKTLSSNLPEDQRTASDLIKAFEDSLTIEIPKKAKTKRPTVILDDDIRCLALKKDGNRCNGRKKIEETLCSLHKRNGVKFGSYTGEPEAKEIVTKPKSKLITTEKDIIRTIVSGKGLQSDSEDELKSSTEDEENPYEQFELE